MSIPISPAAETSNPSRPQVDLSEATAIPCTEPGTGQFLGQIHIDSPKEVDAAVERAKVAQARWRRTSFEQRREVLRQLLAYTVDNKDEICRIVQRDSGKTRENALMGEIWPTCEKFRWMIANGEKHLRPERVSSGLLLHKKARLEFHPLGVVAAIIPWNYPFQNIVNPLIPALMSGNAIIFKPSEWVAWSSSKFITAFRNIIAEAGHNPDIVQAVHGLGATGAALARADVNSILFIGSVENGRRVIEASTEHVTPVVMELGGKDAFIVCDDADIEQAVHAALGGCFINCGQNCVASERILVHEAVYAEFERLAAEHVRAFRQGNGDDAVIDVGAIVTPLQLNVIEKAVQKAIAQGARVVTGAKRCMSDRGDYFEPTILADVTPEMDIMQEEVFGPVMLLCRVRDDAHAIAIANGVSYGLSSSVFSKNRRRARQIAQQLQTGMTAINEFGGVTYMAQDLTFGGVKASGYGRMNGREGLRSMCNIKAVLDDRLPIHVVNRIFPVDSRDYGTFSGVIDLIYSRGFWSRLRGLAQVLAPPKS
jgi:acyl-CoA reductase-like NAD-dependent aldehyde dehydrogenase